uniref:Uncharacterized protein n=1 Tax=Trypanosoma congolense (strain IL3000) TaxID=1068625 RepID=G0UP82_TRYCI|nr:conserved hypothetical protein [Trypanosoma congolense IL3000]
MRANSIERRKEREVALALRQRELDELRARKEQLSGELGMELSALGNEDISTAFPVIGYCGSRPKKDARKIPVENLGSVMNQFEIAIGAITQNNRDLKQQISELNRCIKSETENFVRLREAAKVLADSTGVSLDPNAVQHMGNKSRDGTENDESVQGEGEEETISSLTKQKILVAKEIRAGRQLVKKKEEAVLAIDNALQSRKSAVDELNALYNDIRVTDRDIKSEKETLRQIITEHDAVDAKLNEAIERNVSKTRLLIEQGTNEIKSELAETVSASRRGQERVMKAQEFRVDQLEKRLESIQRALKNNHLSRDVEAIVSQRWASGGDSLVEPYPEDCLYNIEAIIPSQETCHPAIYNLLLTEKERLARRISLLGIIAKEKKEVIDALACKAEALARECQQAIQELDHVASAAAYEEEMQRVEAMEYIQKQRLHYSDLFKEMWKLKSRAHGPLWKSY